jgi:hypothetical protein
MIEDEVHRQVNKLEKYYETLALYVDAELSGETNESVAQVDNRSLEDIDSFQEIPSEDPHHDHFMLEGELNEEAAKDDYIQPEHFPDPDELSEIELAGEEFDFDDNNA